jgi:CRISPR-associated RAMP protein (TIGR02581 family)
MFKQTLNRAVLRIRIDTISPLLIRAGDVGLDPAAADLACVRTRHGQFGRTVYIPGSSLKGVIRSTSEAVVRGKKYGGVEGACDPLNHKASCGSAISSNDKRDTAAVHRRHCLSCRLFGSTVLKGRCSVRDLFPWPHNTFELDGDVAEHFKRANNTEVRHGVSIDRILGSVKHGPFDSEIVPAGVSFWGDIALENYQAWQLGLLSAAIADLNDGFAQLGSTKSRGFGVVECKVLEIIHDQTRQGGETPAGVGSMVEPVDVDSYGLLSEAPLVGPKGVPHGLHRRFTMSGSDAETWLETGIGALGGLLS